MLAVGTRRSFLNTINHPEMKGVYPWRRHTHHIEQLVIYRFAQTKVGHAAGCAAKDRTLTRIQSTPFRRVFLSIVVSRLQIVPQWETEPHTSFAERTAGRKVITLPILTQPVHNMVVHHTFIDKRAFPVELAPSLTRLWNNLIGTVVAQTNIHIRRPGNNGINRQRRHNFLTISMRRSQHRARLGRVRRTAVPDVTGKVQ